MKYTTLLFDLDNTLFDAGTSEAAAFDHALRTGGVADPQRHLLAYVKLNQALWAAVERQELTPNDVQARRFTDLVEAEGLHADPQVIGDAFVSGMGAFGDLYPGAREVLRDLAANATLALVTNGLSEVQRARIERLQLAPLFDAITISGEVATAKPGSRIFDIAFEVLGWPAKDSALMIGDSLSSDIAGGNNYKIATCWYNPSGKSPPPGSQIDHSITTLDQLRGLAASGVVESEPQT